MILHLYPSASPGQMVGLIASTDRMHAETADHLLRHRGVHVIPRSEAQTMMSRVTHPSSPFEDIILHTA